MRVRGHAADSLLRIGLPVLFLLLPFTGGAYELNDVSLNQSVGEARLLLEANGELRYDLFQLENPARVVLDLIGAETPVEPAIGGTDPSGWIVDVRHALWRDLPGEPIIRYVIETKTPAEYQTTVDGGKFCLHVKEDLAAPPLEPTPVEPTDELLDLAPPLGKTDPTYVIAATELSSFSRTNPEGGGAPMSLDVQGADVRTVLRSIAEFSKINIIADTDIVGPMSVRLVEVPWREALDLVCESSGLQAVASREVIRVATRRTFVEEELERESNARKREDLLSLQTEIFPVRFADAAELRQSISFVLSKRGQVEADERTNSLLVTDIGERIGRIREMVQNLDSETQQVEIVAKLVDVDVTASRQLGISWNANNLHSSGERLSGSIAHSSELVRASTELRFGVIRNFGDINARIQALERENKANIISNPSITTVNNRQARILVGKEVPLIVLDESGNPVTELKKVGISLEVTPHINSATHITLDIHPEVSDLSSQATVQGGIVFTTTEADTRVMVGDGETAVIGGLIRTNESHFEEGVPILRSIPILGNLFKSSDIRHDRRELLIFITPRIVRGNPGGGS